MSDQGFRPTGDAGEVSWALNDFFAVDVRLAEVEGRTVVTSIDVYPRDHKNLPINGLTARDLRDVGFDQILSEYSDAVGESSPSPLPAVVGQELESRRGRKRSPEFYAAIADLYLQALRTAPRRPVVHVAEVLATAGHPCGVDQVRSWVNLARQHGFLTEGVSGSAGARPTAELVASRKKNLKAMMKGANSVTGDA
ncbi:MAG: hypothetical protein M3P18_15105 [Actinomycetota bacterium]|nr:hypothetical protein [Actinomycetota bacterium]